MPNPMRGEVEIVISGEPHILRFTLGALRELKEHFGVKSLQDIFADAGNWGPDDLARLFVAGLRRGSMKDATLEIVEEMMVLQELPMYGEALAKALNSANTGSTELPEKAATPDPTKVTADLTRQT